MKYLLLTTLIIGLFHALASGNTGRHADITVAADGSGNFTSLTEALNAMPMYSYQRFVILVKNGVYDEKILIDRDYLTILGESKDSTIIQYDQLRSDWQAKPDYIGAAVVNITADDVILENLTIRNTQPQVGPHAFAVYGTGTRTMLLNCKVISNGGDTVSLWNYKNGMYYHADCYFEGGVDFVCPRGWCYISNSKFYENSKTAAIWHAAVTNKDQKMVLVNCSFDGVQDYHLARHHYEAQFFLVHCVFSETMADKPIFYYHYPNEPEKNRPYFYGDRHYFYDCHRTGGDYGWHHNNDSIWPGQVSPDEVTAAWTFDGKWDPESTTPPVITGYKIKESKLLLYFNELLCIRGKPTLRTSTGKVLTFMEGQGRDILGFTGDKILEQADIAAPMEVLSGEILGNISSAKERPVVVLSLIQ
jgi:pectinesterase